MTAAPLLALNFLPYSDAGFHDRVVIQELLKGMAQSQTLTLESSQKDFKGK